MSGRTNCSHITHRGRPCRNPAVAGTDPPACARHRAAPARQLAIDLEVAKKPAADHFYFPTPTADERRALEESGLEPNLALEVALVRVVLRRLLAYLDSAGGDLPAEELRRISSLLFTGARTVAHLLGQKSAQPEETQEWLIEALAAMAEQYKVKL
jgi:hypothetical protein